MESPQSPSVANTATSLITSTSPTVAKASFLSEAPLLGLCPKPVREMSEQEKRSHLARIRNMRTNFASWRAGVGAESGEGQDKTDAITTGLEDLL